MIKVVALEFLAGGTTLLLFGIHASNSLYTDFSHFFTGSATDKAIWMLVGGTVVTTLGMMGLLYASRKSQE
jgi:hypothetical protein